MTRDRKGKKTRARKAAHSKMHSGKHSAHHDPVHKGKRGRGFLANLAPRQQAAQEIRDLNNPS